MSDDKPVPDYPTEADLASRGVKPEIVTEPPAPLVPATPQTFQDMLGHMVASGYKSAELAGMMDLVERHEKREAEKQFGTSMAECQAEIPLILTDAENQHTRSRYANLETITKKIKPVYTRHGFSLLFGTDESKLAEHIGIYVDVVHKAGHKERYRADIPLDGKGAKGGASSMNACQASGSTMSYGRRYLSCMVFNLVIADEDDDGQGVGGFITPDQIGSLNDLLKASKSDLGRFLKWAQIDGLDKMMAQDFPKAVDMLSRKLAKGEV